MQKIPYIMLLFLSLTVIVAFYFPAMVDLKVQLDETQQSTFRKSVVLQNLVSVYPDSGQLNSLSYDVHERRSVLAAEFFTQSASGNSIGYRINGKHCYIPKVKGLDGDGYGFQINVLGPLPDPDGSVPSECGKTPSSANPVYSPVLLKGEDGVMPARVSVYEIQ